MSYTMTYDSLLLDLRRYLERGFTQASDQIVFDQLPRLITLGERRIARELKIEGFIRAVNLPLVVGTSTYLKPDRWRDTVSMTVGGSSIFLDLMNTPGITGQMKQKQLRLSFMQITIINTGL